MCFTTLKHKMPKPCIFLVSQTTKLNSWLLSGKLASQAIVCVLGQRWFAKKWKFIVLLYLKY